MSTLQCGRRTGRDHSDFGHLHAMDENKSQDALALAVTATLSVQIQF